MKSLLTTTATCVGRVLFLGLFVASLAACKKDKEDGPITTPTPVNEEELITTLILTFTDTTAPTNTYELRFTDLDGESGNPPVITGDTLAAGATYQLSIRVLDESGPVADEITTEILQEDEEHQFFFLVTGADLQISYADADADGMPVGLSNTAITGAASSGSLRVTLIHQPVKAAAGVSSGLIDNAGGETDIAVDLPVVIQ
ncbi:MAG: type 1 periplasmic binding fold superfamily protein [Flavobacteriales bacterium]